MPRLTRSPKQLSDILGDCLIGGIVLTVLTAVGLVVYLIVALARMAGYYGLILPFLPFIIWILGHITFGLGEKPDYCKCGYGYRNMFTEWFHKRKCLPHIMHEMKRDAERARRR